MTFAEMTTKLADRNSKAYVESDQPGLKLRRLAIIARAKLSTMWLLNSISVSGFLLIWLIDNEEKTGLPYFLNIRLHEIWDGTCECAHV